MKAKEIRDLTVEELNQRLGEKVEEMFRLRLRRSAGQLESTAVLKSLRRDIARIKTVRREREVRT